MEKINISTIGIWLLGAVIVVLSVWTAASAYIVWGIEEADHEVLEKHSGYEIRRYAPMLIAETEIEQPGSQAEGQAFRVLAGYIFGGNKAGQKIEMTAPVSRNVKTQGRDIAMTAPVLIDDKATKPHMAFVMPSKFTRQTLPVPNDTRVKIRKVPERKIAVLNFSWQASPSRRAKKTQELLSLLERDGIKPVRAPVYAGFNPPFSVPFLTRHEIQVEIFLNN
jgi:hypothetical protein